MTFVYILISFIIGVLFGLFILRVVQVNNRAHGILIFNSTDPEKEFMTVQFEDNVETLMVKNYVELIIVKDVDIRQNNKHYNERGE